MLDYRRTTFTHPDGFITIAVDVTAAERRVTPSANLYTGTGITRDITAGDRHSALIANINATRCAIPDTAPFYKDTLRLFYPDSCKLIGKNVTVIQVGTICFVYDDPAALILLYPTIFD